MGLVVNDVGFFVIFKVFFMLFDGVGGFEGDWEVKW